MWKNILEIQTRNRLGTRSNIKKTKRKYQESKDTNSGTVDKLNIVELWKCNTWTLKLLFYTLVRFKLEYGSIILNRRNLSRAWIWSRLVTSTVRRISVAVKKEHCFCKIQFFLHGWGNLFTHTSCACILLRVEVMWGSFGLPTKTSSCP